jgi:hypothetical protein
VLVGDHVVLEGGTSLVAEEIDDRPKSRTPGSVTLVVKCLRG